MFFFDLWYLLQKGAKIEAAAMNLGCGLSNESKCLRSGMESLGLSGADARRKRSERMGPELVSQPAPLRRRLAPPPLEMVARPPALIEVRRSPRLAQHLFTGASFSFGTKKDELQSGFDWSTPLLRSPGVSPGSDWFRKYLGSEAPAPAAAERSDCVGIADAGSVGGEVGNDAVDVLALEGCGGAAAMSLDEARHHFDCALEGTLGHLLSEAGEACVAQESLGAPEAAPAADGGRRDLAAWDMGASGSMSVGGSMGNMLPSPASLLESIRVGGAGDSAMSLFPEGGILDCSPRLSPSIFWQSPSVMECEESSIFCRLINFQILIAAYKLIAVRFAEWGASSLACDAEQCDAGSFAGWQRGCSHRFQRSAWCRGWPALCAVQLLLAQAAPLRWFGCFQELRRGSVCNYSTGRCNSERRHIVTEISEAGNRNSER